MRVLDLDPLVAERRAELASGEAEEGDRFIAHARGYDRVRWTGPDGVVNEQDAGVEALDYTPIVLGRL